ncbi:HNH endonuclease [Methylobacterium haplocladii]|uniref:Uncharacterized protein n=1 Tax=Methylobacterium haplocladii TaxID=1176176 RepID=A0A512IN46_9HYPH|nr:HNH endonuclease [Methylobacterium haplocladii]GEO99121.1 hypothetical protein MHA02_15090 [Methylobacterium haplocladii]GJD84782.1 hypothetical protein HPGCJGGD_2665 [Methylobacterium haplocladii]GLS58362.1 hypothetical protein GCM10007887_10220 [Methylobacterium haplocladii]
MSIRKLAAAFLAACLLFTSSASPSQAWFTRKVVGLAAGAAAADWAVVAGTAFVEANVALRSAQLGPTAVAGLSRLLAVHRILGPRAVYISLAKRILEDPSLFARAVQVANMIGLEARLLDERIAKLAEAGAPDPNDPDDCEQARYDRQSPYDPFRTRNDLSSRYQSMSDDIPEGMEKPLKQRLPVESNTIPGRNLPNVAKFLDSPSGLVVNGIPFDNRGFPIFENVRLVRIQLVDRSTFFAQGVGHGDQMILATRELRRQIVEEGAWLGKFTAKQLEDIHAGRARISGLTWHHHQHPGIMELVPTKVHKSVRHVGGWYMNQCYHQNGS